jgi:bifunctional oligoribonuclease and PAP phosphatase NrnA
MTFIKEDLHTLLTNLPNDIVATVHRDPDYDAIGSLLALKPLLNAYNKSVTLFSGDINYQQFSALPNVTDIQTTLTKEHYHTAFFLDCSDKSRIHKLKKFPKTDQIINIDHHQDNTQFGDINIVPNISSVGELLFNIYQTLNIPISTDIATYLYAAICFDTGNFMFANTTPSTLRAAATLLETDIPNALISEQIFEQKDELYFEDIHSGLNNMYVHPKYPFVIVAIPFRQTLGKESTINFFRQYKDKELIIVCKEVADTEYKLSFRSKQTCNVAELAKNYNGGGHIRAAGGYKKMAYEPLLTKLIRDCEQLFK